MNRVGEKSTRWAERLGALPDERDLAVDAALARVAVSVEDSVEAGAVPDAGTDAVAAVSGRGRSATRAAALFRALAESRGEIPRFTGELGEFTAALASARADVEGDLGAVLDEYIALRRRVASGVGSISSG